MLVLAASFSAFAAFSVRSLANSFTLEWDEVEGSLWYDIYIDGNREYKVSWAARDGENNNLDVSIQNCRTLSWDGEYR